MPKNIPNCLAATEAAIDSLADSGSILIVTRDVIRSVLTAEYSAVVGECDNLEANNKALIESVEEWKETYNRLSKDLEAQRAQFNEFKDAIVKGDTRIARLTSNAKAQDRIGAIKLLRQACGMGLAEAKDHVDKGTHFLVLKSVEADLAAKLSPCGFFLEVRS